MIDGNEYLKKVKDYYNFIIEEFNFKVEEEIINGNFFYRIRYKDKTRAVTISYENAEDYLSLFISILQNGKLPNYDDKTKTLHLKQINKIVILNCSKEDINLNNEYFNRINAKSDLERKLLRYNGQK